MQYAIGKEASEAKQDGKIETFENVGISLNIYISTKNLRGERWNKGAHIKMADAAARQLQYEYKAVSI